MPKTKHSMRWWTGSIIFFAGAGILFWDIFAFSSGGLDATISSVLSGYIGSDPEPVPSFIFGFVIGMLICHLTGWWMIPKKLRPKPYDFDRSTQEGDRHVIER